ncbi:MAG: hypothetical protein WC330_02665 [Candidatus Omnitrophota bacterium]|jgi:hypothetical protein
MNFILKLVFIIITLVIYAIDKYSDRDKRKSLSKFWIRTFFVLLLMLLVLLIPEWIDMSKNTEVKRKTLQAITSELGNNQEIANKWEFGLTYPMPFCWNEHFRTIYSDGSVLYHIDDQKLNQDIYNRYAEAKDLDQRLNLCNESRCFEKGDEKDRIKQKLNDLIINTGKTLRELEKRGCNVSNIKSSIYKNDSNKDTYVIFKIELDGRTISSDSATFMPATPLSQDQGKQAQPGSQ